jgi:NaMN:DMB phosphoribosyltransferase
VILAHHMGEQLLLGSLAAGGTTAAAGMLVFGRAKVDAVVRWLRRR